MVHTEVFLNVCRDNVLKFLCGPKSATMSNLVTIKNSAAAF